MNNKKNYKYYLVEKVGVMKKILGLLIIIILLTGCGKVSKDKIIQDFLNDVDSAKSYYVEAKMEIYNAEDTYSYDMKVYYKDDDLFKVRMINTINNHEQIILKDKESVYVVTPSLNKSYKFLSEWPYNSSQAYILSSIARDISNDTEIDFVENDGYTITVDVNYPNNNYLKYEKINFDKNKNLKSVYVYDKDDIMAIKVEFGKIDYKANLSDDEFNIDKLASEECCKVSEDDKKVSALEDVIYPLYIPSNTFLKSKETVNTENGDRVILTFNGDKNFVLIEENAIINDEFEILPVYGDPLMLNNTIGALSTNSLSWTANNVNYYLASNDLNLEEILTIAESLNFNSTTVINEK